MKEEKKQRQVEAIVTKLSSKNTIKVEIESKYQHPKYGKIIKSHRQYLVHVNDDQEIKVGDKVIIGEIRPLSKNKYWEVVKILKTDK